jgi:hypothetical protein
MRNSIPVSFLYNFCTGRRILVELSGKVMTTAATSHPEVIIPEHRNTNIKAI